MSEISKSSLAWLETLSIALDEDSKIEETLERRWFFGEERETPYGQHSTFHHSTWSEKLGQLLIDSVLMDHDENHKVDQFVYAIKNQAAAYLELLESSSRIPSLTYLNDVFALRFYCGKHELLPREIRTMILRVIIHSLRLLSIDRNKEQRMYFFALVRRLDRCIVKESYTERNLQQRGSDIIPTLFSFESLHTNRRPTEDNALASLKNTLEATESHTEQLREIGNQIWEKITQFYDEHRKQIGETRDADNIASTLILERSLTYFPQAVFLSYDLCGWLDPKMKEVAEAMVSQANSRNENNYYVFIRTLAQPVDDSIISNAQNNILSLRSQIAEIEHPIEGLAHDVELEAAMAQLNAYFGPDGNTNE